MTNEWMTVDAKGLVELCLALERAESKGYLPSWIEEQWAAFNYEPVTARAALVSTEAAGEPVPAIFVDMKQVARLMIKHGGHVDSEGWVLNQSGLYDFLHEYLREPGTPIVEPVAWRHSHTHCLYEERDEVPLADGDEWAEPLYTAPPAASGQKLTDLQRDAIKWAIGPATFHEYMGYVEAFRALLRATASDKEGA
ncbi:MAG TPA: hypothetical protein VF783_13845 [Terriglobales bacterium]